MHHREIKKKNIINTYQTYYKTINGGIDGYYEKMILDGDLYELYNTETLGYFTTHEQRGLTSLYVLPKHQNQYSEIFDYILDLSLFKNILFTENDKHFLSNCKRHNLDIETQAYNFTVNTQIKSNIQMKSVTNNTYNKFDKDFKEFITYNNIDINNTPSFYLEKDNQIISFGAIEQLMLNEKRYSISMIVNPLFRGKNYGTETVKYLIQTLQSQNKEINARCYVNNDISKKTLLKSGMIISNKLLKVEEN